MASPRAPLKIVACDAARPLAEEVARCLGTTVAAGGAQWFACGEGKFVVDDNVRGDDLYVFQDVIAPGHPRSVYDRYVMLLHAVEAAALSDAAHITAVLPYYPGARQDKRKNRVREGISAGLFARCLQEAGATRVVSVDLHNEAIAGMFDPGRCRLENVHLTHRMAGWLARHELCGDVVASPDVGGMERARQYAQELGRPLVGLSKERDYSQANTVLRSTLIGSVEGHSVLLVDDIIDTAGSVKAAVEELRDNGATDITVACAHPVMSGPAWDRLGALADRAAAEGWVFRVVGSSAVPQVDAPAWFQTYRVARLLADVVRSLNERGSVTDVQEADEVELTDPGFGER